MVLFFIVKGFPNDPELSIFKSHVQNNLTTQCSLYTRLSTRKQSEVK